MEQNGADSIEWSQWFDAVFLGVYLTVSML